MLNERTFVPHKFNSIGKAFAQGGAKVLVLCLRRKEVAKQTN